jgi:hypothetical protein
MKADYILAALAMFGLVLILCGYFFNAPILAWVGFGLFIACVVLHIIWPVPDPTVPRERAKPQPAAGGRGPSARKPDDRRPAEDTTGPLNAILGPSNSPHKSGKDRHDTHENGPADSGGGDSGG